MMHVRLSRIVSQLVLGVTTTLAAGTCRNQRGDPADPYPGIRYYKVTQATISKTICVKGWTATIRPPSSYTSALKRVQLVVWQYADTNQAHYEEDHLISLELGGAPRSKKNLWPQPWPQARRDDHGIEARPHRQVCNSTLTLRQARLQEVAYKHKYTDELRADFPN
jgi:hypothetical protein